MSKSFREDLTGRRFGRLTVIEFVPTDDKKDSYWKCKCDCGNNSIVCHSNLLRGTTRSCGCLQKELRRKIRAKHNLTKTRLYHIWSNMKGRCYNQKHRFLKDYGGRGIKVCGEWKNDFLSFYNWAMNNGYRDDLSIDRIDVNGDYTPINCRWVDMKTQDSNKRNNLFVDYQGENMCLKEAARQSGINYATLRGRYHGGDRGERLFRPAKNRT